MGLPHKIVGCSVKNSNYVFLLKIGQGIIKGNKYPKVQANKTKHNLKINTIKIMVSFLKSFLHYNN